jgi:hypothetical protein
MILRTLVRRFLLPFAAILAFLASLPAAAQLIPPTGLTWTNYVGAYHPGDVISVNIAVTGLVTPPTGTVALQVTDASLVPVGPPCTVVLDGTGSGQCNFPVPTVQGSYNVTAFYSGDLIYTTLSNTFGFGVAPWSTFVTLTNAVDFSSPIKGGTPVSVIVDVTSAGGPVPVGTVRVHFQDQGNSDIDSVLCAAVPLDGAGHGQCDGNMPSAPGYYILLAEFTPLDGALFDISQGSVSFIEVPILVTNTNATGPGSLYDAVTLANNACFSEIGVSDIFFDIPGPGPHRILQNPALPDISCFAWVNGFSQPGAIQNDSAAGTNAANLDIIVDGTGCDLCNGFEISGSAEIDGLSIVGFAGAGVHVASSGNADLYGNFIGTDASGAKAGVGNGVGVLVDGFATIGSGCDCDANLISGNASAGVRFTASGFGSLNDNTVGGSSSGADLGMGNGIGVHVLSTGIDISGNVVRYNGAGMVAGEFADTVTMVDNLAYDNAGPGIDLTPTGKGDNGDGASANDEVAGTEDADTGANGMQNYPVIQTVTHAGGLTQVTGYLKTDAATSATGEITLYANSKPRTTVTGGETLIYAAPVVFEAANLMTFSFSLDGTYDNISAIATVNRCFSGGSYTHGGAGKSRKATARGSLSKRLRVGAPKATSIFFGCGETSEFSPSVAASVPGLQADVTSLTFAASPGATSAAQTMNLTNNGTATTTIASFVASPSQFTIATNNCKATLPPGASCSIVLTFTAPALAGSLTGDLSITSDATATPVSVSLAGYSLAPLQVTLVTPANPVAGSTTPITVDVTNPNPAGAPAFDDVSGSVSLPSGFSVATTNAGTCPAGTANFQVPPQVTCHLYQAILNVAAAPGPYVFTGVAAANAPIVSSTVSAPLTIIVKTSTLTVTPPSISFGSVVSGTVSAPQGVTIVSSTSAPVAITAVATSPFVADASACASGVTNKGCVITVKFAPAFGGIYSGSLTVTDVLGGGTYTVVLTGISGPPPAPFVSLSPSSGLAFPTRSINTTSPPSSVTLTNTGNANLTITGITVTGDFAFVSSCPATLIAGASCNIDVRFTPLIAGTRTGVLSISSNAAGSPHVLNLIGPAVAVFSGTLDVSPASLDFGNQAIGTTSAVQTVELVNTGSAAVNLSAPSVTGPFALAPVPPQFSACPPVLGAGGACVVAVSFTPAQVGLASGSLVISSDASNPRVTVPLAGTGQVAPPAHALTVIARLDFGVQPFGQRSAGLALTLTNVTGQPVTVADIDASGDFTVDDGCAIVPARGTCTVNVYFTPSARGSRNGSVTVTVAGEGLPYVVVLTGDGGANPNPLLAVTPSFIGFGNAIVGPTQETGSVRLTNVGEVPVLLGAIPSLGDFLVASHCGTSIPVGTSCTVDLAFYPRLIGLRAATLDIPSNAVNGPHGVGLSGIGCSLPNVARSRIPQLVCTP